MNFYRKATIWTKETPQKDCPHTTTKAKPKQHIEVSGATVIRVRDKGAFYRDSYFDGIFLVADDVTINLASPSKEIEVYCLWFGYRLKTRGIKLEIDLAKTELIANYDGEIVKNLAS